MKSIKFLLMAVLMTFGWVAAEVTVASVEQIEIDHYLRFTGTVEAVNQGTASSQTSGRVIETLVDVGDLVNKDDIILQLRDTQQRANLKTAEATVKAAQAQYESAEKEYQRIREVREKKLVAQSALDNALANRDAAQATLEGARARFQDAMEQLEYTRVRAPYSGIVLERHVEVGETVNPGTQLYTGMSLERLRVIAEVPQKDIDAIREFKSARVELPQNGHINISGSALTFFGYADPKTSSFKIRAYLPKDTQGLYPGMYLPTLFKVGVREALVVPQSAVVNRGEVTAIYIQTPDHIEFRQIKPGRQFVAPDGRAMIEILSGARAGDRAILDTTQAVALIKSRTKAD